MHSPAGKRKGRGILLVVVLIIIAAAIAACYFFFRRLEEKADAVPENAGSAVTREEAE